jgi:cytosine/adenosine deaminase-related metal-dependent hydrolase
VVPGSAAVLLQGHVLAADDELVNGQVLVGADGRIACTACDCSAAPGFAGATRVLCPQGVVSPGLIDLTDLQNFTQNAPYPATSERYENREDWRSGRNGHTQIQSVGGASTAQQRIGALRALFAGTTSIGASSTIDMPLVRKLDRAADAAALGEAQLQLDTFPFGAAFDPRVGNCAYTTLPSPTAGRTYLPTLGEGLDAQARNEWLCASGSDLPGAVEVVSNRPVRGVVAPLAADVARMRALGTTWVGAIRSNTALYGFPGALGSLQNAGVPIALATVWPVTGSINLLRELACVDELDARNFGNRFSDRDQWLMATANPARALAADDSIGMLAPGRFGDVVVFDARVRGGYRAVVGADVPDVVLVLRAGVPLHGDATVVADLGGGDGACDTFDMCGRSKRVCASRLVGQTYAQLIAAAGAATYPPFFCGTPANEPSCVPARVAPNVGANFTGLPAAGDGDGDGVADASDNCPASFNPIRLLDAGVQADADGDGIGDECDACALETGNQPCVTRIFSNGFEPS